MATVIQRDISYQDNRARLNGRLYFDNEQEGPRPLVLVLHAYRGPADNEFNHARRLAEAGYAAFVVDVYGNGERPRNAVWCLLKSQFYSHYSMLYQRRLRCALAAVRGQAEVDMGRIGAIGFCAGGVGLLQLVLALPELKAGSIFHMGPSLLPPPERGYSAAVIKVFHGARDRMSPLARVKQLVGAWNAAGVVLNLQVYEEAGHGFTDDSGPAQPGRDYDANAAGDAWVKTLAHFREKLLEADDQAEAAEPEAGHRRRFVITLFHGMGLQNRYMTLDELVQFLANSLCREPQKLLHGNRKIHRVSTHSHRDERDRDIVLELDREMLHEELASGLEEDEKVEIRASEVYWAPIPTGTADAWKTILWLLSGLTSVVRGYVTLSFRKRGSEKEHKRSKKETQRELCERQNFGQMNSAADVWRLFKLLTRLAVVVIVLPLSGIIGSSLVLGWLAYWSVHFASRLQSVASINHWWELNALGLHGFISQPQLFVKFPLFSLPVLLPILGILVPLLFNYVGFPVLMNSVATPLSGLDHERTRQLKDGRLAAMVIYLIMSGIAIAAIYGLLHSYWMQLTGGTHPIWTGSLALIRGWSIAALLLPGLTLVGLMLSMLLRIWHSGASNYRLIGYGAGLILIMLALAGFGTSGPMAALLSISLILLGSWIALLRRGLLFIREYLGDVAAFVSTNENDRMFALRREILQLSEEKLELVLGHDLRPNPMVDRYEASEDVRRSVPRVIVMAHSLGTVVAYQALCRYFERLQELDNINVQNGGEYWLAGDMQRRLKLFVTFGSPLDTIAMAFDAMHSGRPVFDRVVTHNRYRHGCPGAFHHCHWLNWWHRGDVVSAKLLWHAGSKGPVNRQFPLPAPWVVNHSAYLASNAVQEDFRREFGRLL